MSLEADARPSDALPGAAGPSAPSSRPATEGAPNGGIRPTRSLDLIDVLAIARRNWLVVLATIAVAMLAGLLVTATATEVYETETKVLLSPSLTGADDGTANVSPALVAQAAGLVADQAPTIAALAETPAVLDPAIEASGIDASSTEVVDDVDATVLPETSIVSITVRGDSAEDAAELANAIAVSLVDQVEGQNQAGSPVGLTGRQVEAPTVPSAPASPDWALNLLVAFGLGLVVAFLLVVLRQALAAGRSERA